MSQKFGNTRIICCYSKQMILVNTTTFYQVIYTKQPQHFVCHLSKHYLILTISGKNEKKKLGTGSWFIFQTILVKTTLVHYKRNKLNSLKHCVRSQITRTSKAAKNCDLEH